MNVKNELVSFITEPYCSVKTKKVILLDRSDYLVHAHVGPHWPRAALRVHRDLNPWFVPDLSDRDICVTAIKIDNKLCYLCSLYLDIEVEVHNQKFLRLIEKCQRERIPLVTGMDSNAHSPLWGCLDKNTRGEELEDIFLTKNLTVMNVGTEATFETIRAKSIIDVTVVNTWMMQTMNLTDWHVSTEASMSDHKYIYYNLGKYVPVEEMYQNLRKSDWEVFRENLPTDTLININADGSNIDECAKYLEDRIQKALDAACPKKKAIHRKPSPWWTGELEQVRNELKTLNMKKERSDEDAEAFRCLRRVYTNMIARAKRESWRSFCTKAETVKEVSKIIKILKPKPAKGISVFTNQGTTLTPRETLENLMDVHFLDSVPEEMEVMATPRRLEIIPDAIDVTAYINEQKVISSLMSFGPHKAAGPDGLKPLVLQNLTYEIIQYITNLYQMAVRYGYTPTVWRSMRVTFIPKEGKKDYGVAKAYRPITLSNFILKGLERVLQWYINDEIIKEPLYAQHAYTVGRSCDTAVSEVVDFLEKNTYRKQHVLAVSLDCTGAFDRIMFESADMAMKAKQIPSSIRALYMNILKSRKVEAELQGEKISRTPKRGSPQGGVLSPLIWILIMDEILTSFRGTAIKAVGYADDIILMVAGVHPPTLVDLMNKALKKVTKWGTDNGLVFNPAKTQAVRFSQCKKLSEWDKLEMNGTEVDFENNMKYLGVILNRFLLWRPHISERMKKAKKTINLANATIGQKWGLNPEKSLWVYTAMARSVSTYGSLVWASSITDTLKSDLTRLQRKALLSLTSSMRSTPTTGMEAALGLLPLDLKAEEMALKSRMRTRNLLSDVWDGLGNTKKGHRRKLDDTLSQISSTNLISDYTTRQRCWLQLDEIEEPDITLFTDGSHLGGRSGAGWAACHGDTVIAEESVYLGKKATVFQAEVTAIERAVSWALESLDPGTTILIRSDSQSAIQALMQVNTYSKVVLSCKRLLKVAKENLKIAISWIKGHADNTGNELADYLAKQGSELIVNTAEPELPVSLNTVYEDIKLFCTAKWQARWDNQVDCRQTKIFVPKVKQGKLNKLKKLNKKELNLIVQACTGHALVNHHISKWNNIEDICEMCLESEETTSHLYFECPALWQAREERKSLENMALELNVLRFFSRTSLTDLLDRRSRELNEERPFLN